MEGWGVCVCWGEGVIHKNPVLWTESQLLLKQGRGPPGGLGGRTPSCCTDPLKLLGIRPHLHGLPGSEALLLKLGDPERG